MWEDVEYYGGYCSWWTAVQEEVSSTDDSENHSVQKISHNNYITHDHFCMHKNNNLHRGSRNDIPLMVHVDCFKDGWKTYTCSTQLQWSRVRQCARWQNYMYVTSEFLILLVHYLLTLALAGMCIYTLYNAQGTCMTPFTYIMCIRNYMETLRENKMWSTYVKECQQFGR